MTRFKPPDVEETIGCNLIPMIDIMFLLLLFFMLGADMAQRELDELVLPQADMVQEEPKTRDATERTTVNVVHREPNGTETCPQFLAGKPCRQEEHWTAVVRGRSYDQDSLRAQLTEEARLDPEKGGGTTPGGVPLSARAVMVRADQLAPFGIVQRVIETCGKAGLYKLEIGAAKPEAAE